MVDFEFAVPYPHGCSGMQSGRPPSVTKVLLCCSVGNDLRTGPADVRRGHLLGRRNLEARIHVDGLRERFRSPRSVSFADAAGAMTSDRGSGGRLAGQALHGFRRPVSELDGRCLRVDRDRRAERGKALSGPADVFAARAHWQF